MIFVKILMTAIMSFAFESAFIKVKTKKLYVQLAKTEQERQQGLMHRKKWGDYQGMLFVFSQQRHLSFWMKNTYLPLSIGFFNQDFILVDIQKMKVHQGKGQPPSYRSKALALYALEVPMGWFEENGIGLGSRLSLK